MKFLSGARFDADLLVLGQEFANVEGYLQYKGWPGHDVGTNKTLVELVAAAGFTITTPKEGASEDKLFFTNAVLCMKPGGMQDPVKSEWRKNCGSRFLRPTIEIVQPRAVVTLGRVALNAVLEAYELPRVRRFIDVVSAGTTYDLPSGPRVFPVCHPSRSVINTTRSMEKQLGDWARIGEWLDAQRAQPRSTAA